MSNAAGASLTGQSCTNATRFVTFFVAELFFGVDVLEVQEVLQPQRMTRVPLAPAMIEGLLNLRGQIVTAIDMRRRLGLAARPGAGLAVHVVVRTQGGAVSLLVDEIDDVLDAEPGSYEPAPDSLAPGLKELLRGVYKLQGRLLLILDTEKVREAALAHGTVPAKTCRAMDEGFPAEPGNGSRAASMN